MAYSNIAGGILLQLRLLLEAEFGASIPVFFTTPGTERAPEWFEVRLVRSEPVEQASYGATRLYRFEVTYLMQENGESDLDTQSARLEMVERLQRVLLTSRALSGYWYNGQIGAVEYGYSPQGREDERLIGTRLEWTLWASESIS